MSLISPENLKKIYNVEKKLWSFVYQNEGFGECPCHFNDAPKWNISAAVNWNTAVTQIRIVVFANKNIFAGKQ